MLGCKLLVIKIYYYSASPSEFQGNKIEYFLTHDVAPQLLIHEYNKAGLHEQHYSSAIECSIIT